MSATNKDNVPTKKIDMGANKKPTIRKPPVVKQTLTSIYRTLKANPVLLLNYSKENPSRDFDVSGVKIQSTRKPMISRSEEPILHKVFKRPVTNKVPQRTDTALKEGSILKKGLNTGVANKMLSSKLNMDKVPVKPNRTAAKSVLQQKDNLSKTASTSKLVKRRSLSAEHFDKIKTKNLTYKENRTNKFTGKSKTEINLPDISPIIEKSVHRVTFKTSPHNGRKRSLSCSATPSRKSMYVNMASTPKPAQTDLQQRLEEWLQKQNKPIERYHHLKCFGFKNLKPKIDDYDDENKENIDMGCASTSSSYENLNISQDDTKIPNAVDTPITYSSRNGTSDIEMRYLARGALTDLHALIKDGYSNKQCEAWLGMIRQKYSDLEEEPQYWECRAAIEQTRGDITSAVDCLRTAIVHGAEVKVVDGCLEQLLQKFSLLNINESENSKSDTLKKDRTRILCDARNIFKSTIIQFAIQERTLKKKPLQEIVPEKKFTATPVRRSTRRRTLHVSTPGIQLCTTLQELEPNIREQLNFENNSALSVK